MGLKSSTKPNTPLQLVVNDAKGREITSMPMQQIVLDAASKKIDKVLFERLNESTKDGCESCPDLIYKVHVYKFNHYLKRYTFSNSKRMCSYEECEKYVRDRTSANLKYFQIMGYCYWPLDKLKISVTKTR